MKKADKTPEQGLISTTPFPGSKKIYVEGTLHKKIRVAMREISLQPTKLTGGKTEDNASVVVYDTSGAYT
ncbi:phosphomethylpyrimidine synthase ThiC, partial [Shewanella algae]